MSYYGTLNDADLYFLTKRLDPNQLWATTPTHVKEAALEDATRRIDRLNFIGDKTDEGQELEFPRGGDTVVPTKIKEACYEIAYSIVDGKDLEFELESLGEQSASYGGARVRKDPLYYPEAYLNGIPSFNAWAILKPYLRDNQSIRILRAD